MNRPMKTAIGRGLVAEFLDAKSDYQAAKQSQLKRVRTGLVSTGSHADYHLRNDLDHLKMTEYARAMDRDDIVFGQMFSMSADFTCLHGVEPVPETGRDDLNAELAKRFAEWADSPDMCDAKGEEDFWCMQRNNYRQSQIDGDLVTLFLNNGKLLNIESHRIRTPKNTKRNVVLGVLLGDQREKLEFWVTNEDVALTAAVQNVGDITPYPVRDEQGYRVLAHLYDPRRTSQTRGVTAAAPLIDTAGQFEDIQFATLVKQQIAACVVEIRNRTSDYVPMTSGGQSGERTVERYANGRSRTTDGLSPGARIAGEIGEQISLASPNVPSTEYFPHVRMTLQLLGINLNLPLCMFLMDAAETNFNGFTGAMDVAKPGWLRSQRRIARQWVEPVYRWRVRYELNRSPALRRMGATVPSTQLYKCRSTLPKWPYIQPLRDASAAALRLSTHQTSPQRFHEEVGTNAFAVLDETIAFNGTAIERAIARANELNAKFANLSPPITWRDVWQPAPPTGVNVSINASPPEGGNGGPNRGNGQ